MVLVSLGTNQSDNVLARLGFESGYLMMAAVSLFISWLVVDRQMISIIFVAVLAIATNLPHASAMGIGYERDVVAAVWIAFILLPYFISFVGWDE